MTPTLFFVVRGNKQTVVCCEWNRLCIFIWLFLCVRYFVFLAGLLLTMTTKHQIWATSVFCMIHSGSHRVHGSPADSTVSEQTFKQPLSHSWHHSYPLPSLGHLQGYMSAQPGQVEGSWSVLTRIDAFNFQKGTHTHGQANKPQSKTQPASQPTLQRWALDHHHSDDGQWKV